MNFKINETDDYSEVIIEGLKNYNLNQVGYNETESFYLEAVDNKNQTIGGLISRIYWDWVELNLIWVKEDFRGQKIGKKLLERLEQHAKNKKCVGIYLDTFSFQAPDFYIKQGYEIFGELKQFPKNENRFFLKKML